MQVRRWLSVCCGLLALAAAAAKPIVAESFDQDVGAWKLMGDEQGSLQSQIAVAKQVGALEARYRLDADHKFAAAFCPLAKSVADARAVRFWVRTGQPSLLGVALAQRNGARYFAVFTTAADTWVRVEMSLDRFRLAQDSQDPGGKLDPAQVNACGVVDVTGLFVVNKVPGARVFYLDEFEIVPDEALNAYSANGKPPLMLDNFESDPLSWLPLAGKVERDAKAHQLVWTYGHERGLLNMCGVITMLGQLPAAGARQLSLTWRSDRDRLIAVVLQEERRGDRPERRYHQILPLKASDKVQTLTLDLAKFQLDAKERPGDTKPLELANVGVLIIADLDVMAGKAGEENTLRIEEVLLTGN